MTDIKYGGMMCPHGHVKAACAICATPPKSPPMTDPKPATPAADGCICEDIRVLGACPVHEPRSTEPANDNLVAAWLADLQGMDDADREHDVTVLDTRSLLYRIAADAETIRKQAEEIERLKAQVQVGHDVIRDFDSRIDTARAQVETLREALVRLSCHPCRFKTASWVTCKGPDPRQMCDMCHASAALATTEPKG